MARTFCDPVVDPSIFEGRPLEGASQERTGTIREFRRQMEAGLDLGALPPTVPLVSWGEGTAIYQQELEVATKFIHPHLFHPF